MAAALEFKSSPRTSFVTPFPTSPTIGYTCVPIFSAFRQLPTASSPSSYILSQSHCHLPGSTAVQHNYNPGQLLLICRVPLNCSLCFLIPQPSLWRFWGVGCGFFLPLFRRASQPTPCSEPRSTSVNTLIGWLENSLPLWKSLFKTYVVCFH